MNIVADKNIPHVEAMYSPFGKIILSDGHSIRPDTVEHADALIVRSVTKVDRALLEKSNVRFVGTTTIGTDHVDIDYLREHNIAFASAPGSNAQSVAEYVLTALLTIAEKKKIQLNNLSAGIIGVGNVGKKVEQVIRAIGLKTLLNDPPLERASGDHERYCPLNKIFDADIVTLHVPLTSKGSDPTYHLVNDQFLSKLKPETILINTSRGAVIESAALKNNLATRRLGACIFDVWADEPNIDVDILHDVDLGTPHIAGHSYDGKMNGAEMIFNSFCAAFDIDYRCQRDRWFEKLENNIIKIDDSHRSIQNILLDVAKQCYDIERDDADLRKILNLEIHQRADYFRNLRRNYPKRYEFKNWIVTKSSNPELNEIFQQLGFSLKG